MAIGRVRRASFVVNSLRRIARGLELQVHVFLKRTTPKCWYQHLLAKPTASRVYVVLTRPSALVRARAARTSRRRKATYYYREMPAARAPRVALWRRRASLALPIALPIAVERNVY